MEKQEFYYYLHKTKLTSPDMIQSLFNEGLKSEYGYSINSTMMRINENDLLKNGLFAEIVDYIGQGDEYDSVVVIKIPKRYFCEIKHRDGSFDSAIPMFREYHEEGWNWNSIFTPKLIQGVYCRDIDKSFTNPNFCPIFNPNGCQFSKEQITNFETYNFYDWRKIALDRQKSTFEELVLSDRENNTWGDLVDYYSQFFGVKPKPMIQFELSDNDKALFGGRHR